MPLRLAVHLAGRTRRLSLGAGPNLLGSDPEADLVVPEPSVSRRHAELTVSGGRVTIRDLGSRNGTWLGEREVGEAALELAPGTQLRFGLVTAVLEEVGEEDLRPAIRLSPAPRPRPTPTPAATTPAAAVEAFVARHVAGILEAVYGGASSGDVARRVGAALVGLFPLTELEIRCGSGILFRAARDEGAATGERETLELGGGGIELRARLARGLPLQRVEAALRTGLWLVAVAAAADEQPASAPSASPVAPGATPPEPPSLDPVVQEIYDAAARVARGEVSVLIRGESGTGKELLARYLHRASGRPPERWVALNCAAIPRDLLEAELFGVEPGVATGVNPRVGKLEEAHGGTLFLDEVGDMAPETQAKILRVLQEGEVFRLGGREARPARVRVVAATNRDLAAAMASGDFRADLYHRLAGWEVELPPLRRRPTDIPNLAAHLLERSAKKAGVRPGGISQAAVERLLAYAWPGNVRELETEMARAALFLSDGELLETRHLKDAVRQASSPETLEERVRSFERGELTKAFAAAGGNASEAARRLGISRSTLYRRLRALDLDPSSLDPTG